MEQLGNKVGMSRQAVDGWEKNRHLPRRDIEKALMDLLGLPPEAFSPHSDSVGPLDSAQQSARVVPLIEWGDMHQLIKGAQIMDLAESVVQVPERWAITKDDFFTDVVDNSMAPEFNIGDSICVRRGLKPTNGCVVVVCVDGRKELLLRRYLRRGSGATDLIPENESYASILLPSAVEPEIIGVVVAKLQSMLPP